MIQREYPEKDMSIHLKESDLGLEKQKKYELIKPQRERDTHR